MSTLPRPSLTPEQYLRIERAASFRSEFFDGEMFAMAGARQAHNRLVANLIAGLHRHFRSRPCDVYPSDMRVCVNATGLYTYPDVVAVCGEQVFLDDEKDTLLNPGLLIEVLSPSTEAYDRGRKFEQYQSIESLREYLLVASDRAHVDLYSRQGDGRWLLTSVEGRDSVLTLESVGVQFTLADLYEKVDFTN